MSILFKISLLEFDNIKFFRRLGVGLKQFLIILSLLNARPLNAALTGAVYTVIVASY